jgi:lipoprotein-anchoring transpeptidase ErfK/SrfK
MPTISKPSVLAFVAYGWSVLTASAQQISVPIGPAVSHDVKPPIARIVPEHPAETPLAPLSFNQETKTAPPPSKTDVEGITRVQIFLDENNFGPGKIDGEMGEFTRKAGQIFNQVHGIAKHNWYAIIVSARKLVTSTYASYRLRENDFRFLVPSLPAKPEDQSQYKYLGYHDIMEFIGEKFHTSEVCLTRLNPNLNFNTLKAGDLVVVPNVKSPFCIEQVPYSQKYPEDPILSAHRVVVDTTERVATFYDAKDQLFASFPITPGQKKFIHVGNWIVGTMITTPEFRWDKAMLDEGKRSEQFYQLPPGPNNPVGIFWAGTNKTGIGLHGTSSPETIGRSESHGCVRLANWDAIRLPALIRPGAKMEMK